MKAKALRDALEHILDANYHKLTFDQQMYVSGMVARFDDLIATERFVANAISNAAKELAELEARMERLP